MVSPPLASVKLKEPSLDPEVPPAMVATLLLVLLNVKVPAPDSNKLLAETAPVCVSAVAAPSVSVEPVAVTAPVSARVPP